ncbi:MAG: LuxR C-terminal-related transcriptional regulator [Ekhidna sp.]
MKTRVPLKTYLVYGGAMGIIIILMEVIQYKAVIRDLQIELFGIFIALIFLSVGIGVGILIYKKKVNPDQYDRDKLGLSKRELEVLELLSQGLSNQEIADKLFVSLNTSKTHISKIYQKMNVKRRTQAIQKARDYALITSSKE